MNKLPIEIQIEFFKLFNNDMSIEQFEQFVYSTKELETFLEEDDYIEFISLNFKKQHVIHEIRKVIDKYLDFGEFEKSRVNKVLTDLISKNDDFAKSLMSTYDMYCDGYYFLDNIGMGYGLTFVHDFYEIKDWLKLPKDEKERRVNEVYVGVKSEADKVQDWIDRKKIILTGEVDEIGRYAYIDNRSSEEKIPTGYSVISSDSTFCRSLSKALKAWWQKLFGN